MKNTLVAILVAILSIALVGCNDDSKKPKEGDQVGSMGKAPTGPHW